MKPPTTIPRRFPARSLSALTGIGLLLAAAFLTTEVELLIDNDIWRMLYAFAGLELLIIAVTPMPGSVLRATAASITTIVLIGRATALVVDLTTTRGALGPLNPLVAVAAWLIIAAHTNALLVFWPGLTNTYVERQ